MTRDEDDYTDDELRDCRRRLELARGAIVALQNRVTRLEAGQRALRAAGRAPTGVQQRQYVLRNGRGLTPEEKT
jgi:hypothetical protein